MTFKNKGDGYNWVSDIIRVESEPRVIKSDYVSPQRIAIAVRDDINDEILRDVFDEKFISNLTLLKKPILDEIVSGKWL